MLGGRPITSESDPRRSTRLIGEVAECYFLSTVAIPLKEALERIESNLT